MKEGSISNLFLKLLEKFTFHKNNNVKNMTLALLAPYSDHFHAKWSFDQACAL